MTETYIRSQDFRRLKRAKKKKAAEWIEDEPENNEEEDGRDEEPDEDLDELGEDNMEDDNELEGEGDHEQQGADHGEAEKRRSERANNLEGTFAQSAKASYIAKVTSAVIGYGSNWELAQFVYDLWMFTTIGGAKNAAGVSMRAALAGKTVMLPARREMNEKLTQ